MCKSEIYNKLKNIVWETYSNAGAIRNDRVSSWAIWEAPNAGDDKKTSNMSGERIFKDFDTDKINTEYVFIGLNASSDADDYPWASFHKQGSNDYKLRYALNDSKYRGSYITDVIKTKQV